MPSKGIVYYTHRTDGAIYETCRKQIDRASDGMPIVNVSIAPVDWHHNIVLEGLVPGDLAMFKQQLAGLEAIDTDIVFFCEHERKAAERAAQLASYGGGSGGRGIPPNGPQNKPRMPFITYAALPKNRKAEIRSMARNGQIELYSVSGRGAAERVETIDPRNLSDE